MSTPAGRGPLHAWFSAYPEVRTAPHRDGPRDDRTAAEALCASARQHERPRRRWDGAVE